MTLKSRDFDSRNNYLGITRESIQSPKLDIIASSTLRFILNVD